MFIKNAVQKLKNGEVLILPTDTLYGLGALAYNFDAVKKVFDLKKRAYKKALPVHYYDIKSIEKDCFLPEMFFKLTKKFWPGALTIVLKKREDSKLKFVEDTVAVRIPKCAILLEILKDLEAPLVMPSANISDSNNIFKFDILVDLFEIEGIKDDVNLSKTSSTIISLIDTPKILREGDIKINLYDFL